MLGPLIAVTDELAPVWLEFERTAQSLESDPACYDGGDSQGSCIRSSRLAQMNRGAKPASAKLSRCSRGTGQISACMLLDRGD